MSLTFDAVHRIRTSGLSDAHFARLYRVTRQTVRSARIGETFTDNPTPPDLRERDARGRLIGEPVVVAAEPTQRDISRLLACWRLPDTSTPEHP